MPALLESTVSFELPAFEFCTIGILHGRRWFTTKVEGSIDSALETAQATHAATGFTVQVVDQHGVVVQQFGHTDD